MKFFVSVENLFSSRLCREKGADRKTVEQPGERFIILFRFCKQIQNKYPISQCQRGSGKEGQILSSHSLRGIKRGLSGVLTVGSSLRQPSSLPNISPPLPLLSRLVHRGIQVEGQGKRGLLSHVYVLVPAVASIMVNYTQHTPSKTDTQQVLELPGCFDSFQYSIQLLLLERSNCCQNTDQVNL